MITRKHYKVIFEEDHNRITHEYTDTFLLGIRIRRDIQEAGRRGAEVPIPLRDTIRRLDCYQCVYCGIEEGAEVRTGKKRGDAARFAVDHITPQIMGGSSHIFNLAYACMQCNSAKQGRTPNESGMTLGHGRFRGCTKSKHGIWVARWVDNKLIGLPPTFQDYVDHKRSWYLQFSETKQYSEDVENWNSTIGATGEWGFFAPGWIEIVQHYNYGQPFTNEFIKCYGKIPYLHVQGVAQS